MCENRQKWETLKLFADKLREKNKMVADNSWTSVAKNFTSQSCIIYSIQNSPVKFRFDILRSFKQIVLIGIDILCSFCICETWLLRKNVVGSFLFIAFLSKVPDL